MKLAVGRPRKEEEWKVGLVKMMRDFEKKESSIQSELEAIEVKKAAIKTLLNGDAYHAKS